MLRGTFPLLLALAWLACSAGGCAAGPDGEAESLSSAEIDSPSFVVRPPETTTGIAAEDYDAVFDAAVWELRDRGYRIARNDRRFGTITTYPKESPTLFEPWVGDNTTGDLARRSTLNDLRRLVTVTIHPADGAISEVGDDYTLTVEAALERRQRPSRYLTHSARGGIAADYRSAPAHLAQRGIPAEYWEEAGSDPHLAEQLLNAIAQRAQAEQLDPGLASDHGIDD